MSSFSIHFDGPITIHHKVPIRVLARTYEHMQRAIDRAYLIERYGEVWKHARLTDDQYAETEFIAEYPREGGIILDAVRAGAGGVIDRIAASIRPVFENAIQEGINDHQEIAQQHIERLRYVQGMRRNTPTFSEVSQNPPPGWSENYSNRSVIKEIDQLVGQITPERLEGSTVEVILNGNRPHLPFAFDAERAKRFRQIASRKDLGPPMIANVVVRSLDRGNRYTKPGAKVLNIDSQREVTLKLSSIADCDELHRHHDGQAVEIYVCPVIEAMGYDIHGGDLMYISTV